MSKKRKSPFEFFYDKIVEELSPGEDFRIKDYNGVWHSVTFVEYNGSYYICSNVDSLNGSMIPDEYRYNYKYSWYVSEDLTDVILEIRLPFKEKTVLYAPDNKQRFIIKKTIGYVVTVATQGEIKPEDKSERILSLDQLLEQKWIENKDEVE